MACDKSGVLLLCFYAKIMNLYCFSMIFVEVLFEVLKNPLMHIMLVSFNKLICCFSVLKRRFVGMPWTMRRRKRRWSISPSDSKPQKRRTNSRKFSRNARYVKLATNTPDLVLKICSKENKMCDSIQIETLISGQAQRKRSRGRLEHHISRHR